MNTPNLQNISLYILLAVFGLIAGLMFFPFLNIIALGAILAVLFFPLKLRIAKYIKSETLASLTTLVLASLIVIVPLYGIGQLAFNEIYNLYSHRSEHGQIIFNAESLVRNLPAPLAGVVQDILNNIGEKIGNFAGNLFQSFTTLAANVAGFVIDFVLLAFTFYYLLRDGQKFKNFIGHILPLPLSQETLLVEKVEMAVKGVVQGSFLVALTQGLVATVGFLIFGVPGAFLWGAFTVLAALVPNFGTSLSLVPAVLYLFITGHTGAGIGMSIWGALAVGTIDNILGPQLVGARTQLHPLLVLFSVIGGMGLFGILGFLIGPILMAIFVTLMEIYRRDS